jgi:IS6 family transposase
MILNNIVEQDHRFIKKITKLKKKLKGIEAMHIIRKGQAENNSTALSAMEWHNKIFGLAA